MKPPDDNDVTTFSGFGSWMQTFTPEAAPSYSQHEETSRDRPRPHVHELDNHVNDYHELDAGGTGGNHWRAELPADELFYDHKPSPVPAPKPVPDSLYRPTPAPYPVDDYPEPVPRPAPAPIHKTVPAPQPIQIKEGKKAPVVRKIVYEEVPDPMTKVEVRGLRKAGTHAESTNNVSLSVHGFLEDVANNLKSSGYEKPLGFAAARGNPSPLAFPTGLGEAAWPILITKGRSCYDPDKGLRMHIEEPFSVFLARIQLSVTCVDSRLLVNNGDLKVAFHRTLRVPEDSRVHKLPASFGRFPVQNVAAYSKKLLGSKNASLLDMANKGGVFFPVFQREAMWLSFDAPAGSEYKVRVFVGGVNVVTGKKWDDNKKKSTYDGYGNDDDDDQDYILVPPQEHLDGIAVGNGIVRQFVAMPTGSGYSIEKQITGKEDVGGVQLEITPLKRRMDFFHRGREVKWQTSPQPEIASPSSYGLESGEYISTMRFGGGSAPPFLGGKARTHQKKTLRQLLDQTGAEFAIPPTIGITALYPMTFQIKMPGKLIKHKIMTPAFSPLDTVGKVIKETKYKGKDLSGYGLAFSSVLSSWETLWGAGLPNGAVLEAFKNFKSSNPHAIGAAPQSAPMGMQQQGGMGGYGAPQGGVGTYGPPQAAMGTYGPSGTYGSPTYNSPSGTQSQSEAVAPMAYHQSTYAPAQAVQSPSYGAAPTAYENSTGYSAPALQQTSSYSPSYQYDSRPPLAAPTSHQTSPQSPPSPPSGYYSSPAGATQLPSYNRPASYGASSTSPSRPTQQAQQAPPSYGPSAPYNTPLSLGAAPQSHPPPTSPAPQQPFSTPSAPTSPTDSSPALGTSSPYATYSHSHSHSPHSPSTHAPPPQKNPEPKPESWTMSLSPGGLLSQQLHRDPTPPAYRTNTSFTSCLISIQLLNAVAYEALTGMLCPPTPITAQQYAASNIPWFDTYAPHMQSVGAGTGFSAIKSVSEIDAQGGIEAGTSVSESMKVACTSCARNLCDCVLRPCNHAFCGVCVRERMVANAYGGGREVRCAVCRAVARQVLGFSAPMALPGMEEYVPDGAREVVVKVGVFGSGVGEGVGELE